LVEYLIEENPVRTIAQGLIEEQKNSTNERVERAGSAMPTHDCISAKALKL
jgi:hypothetical protein